MVSATKGTDNKNKGSFQMRSGLGFYSPRGGSPWRAGEDGSGGRSCMGASFKLPLRTMQFHSDHQVAGLSAVSGLGLALEASSLYTGYHHPGLLGAWASPSPPAANTRAETCQAGGFYTSKWVGHS